MSYANKLVHRFASLVESSPEIMNMFASELAPLDVLSFVHAFVLRLSKRMLIQYTTVIGTLITNSGWLAEKIEDNYEFIIMGPHVCELLSSHISGYAKWCRCTYRHNSPGHRHTLDLSLIVVKNCMTVPLTHEFLPDYVFKHRNRAANVAERASCSHRRTVRLTPVTNLNISISMLGTKQSVHAILNVDSIVSSMSHNAESGRSVSNTTRWECINEDLHKVGLTVPSTLVVETPNVIATIKYTEVQYPTFNGDYNRILSPVELTHKNEMMYMHTIDSCTMDKYLYNVPTLALIDLSKLVTMCSRVPARPTPRP